MRGSSPPPARCSCAETWQQIQLAQWCSGFDEVVDRFLVFANQVALIPKAGERRTSKDLIALCPLRKRRIVNSPREGKLLPQPRQSYCRTRKWSAPCHCVAESVSHRRNGLRTDCCRGRYCLHLGIRIRAGSGKRNYRIRDSGRLIPGL